MQTLTRRELTRTKTHVVVGWLEADDVVAIKLSNIYPRIVAYLVTSLPEDELRYSVRPLPISKITTSMLSGLDEEENPVLAYPIRLGQVNDATKDREPEAWLVPAEWRERLGL